MILSNSRVLISPKSSHHMYIAERLQWSTSPEQRTSTYAGCQHCSNWLVFESENFWWMNAPLTQYWISHDDTQSVIYVVRPSVGTLEIPLMGSITTQLLKVMCNCCDVLFIMRISLAYENSKADGLWSKFCKHYLSAVEGVDIDYRGPSQAKIKRRGLCAECIQCVVRSVSTNWSPARHDRVGTYRGRSLTNNLCSTQTPNRYATHCIVKAII